MKWIEVLAHRILVVSGEELKDFELIDADGKELSYWSASNFVMARKGNRTYRKAALRPNNNDMSFYYLEEV